jgi:hypothetical protein
MRYMLMIYGEEKEWEAKSEPERDAVYQACVNHSEPRRPSGFYQGGGRLEPTRTATTVRMKDGKAVVTDGPFAETKEQLAGYTILDATDLDEALAFVAHHPLVRAGFSIEVRPFRVVKPT